MTIRHATLTDPLCWAAVLALSSMGNPATAAESKTLQSEKHAFRIVTLVQGLQHPWSLAFLPDGRMLVTERPGRLREMACAYQHLAVAVAF